MRLKSAPPHYYVFLSQATSSLVFAGTWEEPHCLPHALTPAGFGDSTEKIFYLFIIRERKREGREEAGEGRGKRGRETSIGCPDWESNQ